MLRHANRSPGFTLAVLASAWLLLAAPVPYSAPSGDLDLNGQVNVTDVQCAVQLFSRIVMAMPIANDQCTDDVECAADLGDGYTCREWFGPERICLPGCLAPAVTLGASTAVNCGDPAADDGNCLGLTHKLNADMNCDGMIGNPDMLALVALATGKLGGPGTADYDDDGRLNFCDDDTDGDGIADADDCGLLDEALGECDDDNECTQDTCGDGECVFEALTGPLCDDLDPCTHSESCNLGLCTGGIALNCEDGNPCTDDSCAPDSSCTHIPAEGFCEEGNPCTGPDQCVAGVCEPGPANNCYDDNPCTDDSCDPDSGCVNEYNNAICDDDNPCTDDSCLPDGSCVNIPNDASCNNDDPCTTDDQCAGGDCQSGEAVECDDSNPCTDDQCGPDGSCGFVPNSVACDDDDLCTENDQCSGGECSPGSQVNCDDADPCTTNSCQSDSGCSSSPAPDETQCPGGSCQGGQCVAGDVKVVFVSSVGHNGKFGGVTGADSFCQGRANAAGLSGTFKAWLSGATNNTSPKWRFSKSDIPYALPDGTVIADDWADLTDGTIQNPINRDEFGNQTSFYSVFSFTRVDGTPGLFGNPDSNCYGADCHCANWTSDQQNGKPNPGSGVGKASAVNDDWTDYSFGNFCGGSFGVYCFEQ